MFRSGRLALGDKRVYRPQYILPCTSETAAVRTEGGSGIGNKRDDDELETISIVLEFCLPVKNTYGSAEEARKKAHVKISRTGCRGTRSYVPELPMLRASALGESEVVCHTPIKFICKLECL